jgi:hypothetical protein
MRRRPSTSISAGSAQGMTFEARTVGSVSIQMAPGGSAGREALRMRSCSLWGGIEPDRFILLTARMDQDQGIAGRSGSGAGLSLLTGYLGLFD